MKPKHLADIFALVRERRPLVHHITNYVTVNDCANITLCAGGAPVMADAPEEVEEMAAVAGALVLNIGTLNTAQIGSMLLAGRMANEREIPVILDPVGAGATRMRTACARRLLDELEIAVLKGNAGEIGVIAGAEGRVRGVDSHGLEGDPVAVAKGLARSLGITVAVSGATDIVTNGRRVILVDNGHPMMGSISGTGCMAASVTGTFAAVSHDTLAASVAAFAAFGIAGERAAAASCGPGSFKQALFDELAALVPADLSSCARIRSP
ncbi:MAG: hydroxyethylthiazole kinase [Methanoregula sp.]|jgi:hydroxyethylthiazole kinase|uniref:hydroxyethylthiazole kinase n=1 Tax=Methanoregula sp. TaxID=2052170 RepID=UPI003D130507